MRRVLSVVVAVTLLLGLGALAVMALPPATASLAVVPSVSAAQPEAPAATLIYNMIGMPLDSQNQLPSWDAAGLAAVTGNGVEQVLEWQAGTQSYVSYLPPLQDGTNFALNVGRAYWLQLNSTASSIVSFVGNVPAQGSIHFALTRPSVGGCLLNDITIPLDRADITNADQLATAMGNVEQVLQWSATTQSYVSWLVDLQDGTNFDVKIGYPYRLCLLAGGVTNWP